MVVVVGGGVVVVVVVEQPHEPWVGGDPCTSAGVDELVALRGIGVWTAEWILARTLGRPRVVAGDLGVRKAVGIAYREGVMPSEAEVRDLTAHWHVSAAHAQALLLHGLGEKELGLLAAIR